MEVVTVAMELRRRYTRSACRAVRPKLLYTTPVGQHRP